MKSLRALARRPSTRVLGADIREGERMTPTWFRLPSIWRLARKRLRMIRGDSPRILLHPRIKMVRDRHDEAELVGHSEVNRARPSGFLEPVHPYLLDFVLVASDTGDVIRSDFDRREAFR